MVPGLRGGDGESGGVTFWVGGEEKKEHLVS